MKIKRNKKSYRWFLCGLILVVVLTISYRVSKANYRISNSIELTTGKVISSPYDFNLISMYIDGVEQDKNTNIPDNGYVINEEQSYCYKESKSNKDTNIKLYTDELGNHVFSGISKSSKCILYLNKVPENNCGSACQYILSNIDTINIRRKDYLPFNESVTGDNAPTEKIMYEALDDDGTSYYFAGNPTDNWVLFGGYYWRIIRINGDGSIRMIYQGSESDGPQTTGVGTAIGSSKFNDEIGDNAYIGFMYGTLGSTTYEETHTNTNDSSIKKALDNWYEDENNHLKDYEQFIDKNAGFCGDRVPSSNMTNLDGIGGMGNTTAYYGAFIRLTDSGGVVMPNSLDIKPSFKCVNNKDLYTYKTSIKGNNELNYPIGLITADEVSYAGLIANWNKNLESIDNNYLVNKINYWTMSPALNGGIYNSTMLFNVWYIGYLTFSNLNFEFFIRPVINLRSDVEFTGNGTDVNPYKVIS